MDSSGDVQHLGVSQLYGSNFDWTLEIPTAQLGSQFFSSTFTDINGNEWQLKLSGSTFNPKHRVYDFGGYDGKHQLDLILLKVGENVGNVEALVNLSVCPHKTCFSECYQQELSIMNARPVNFEINQPHTQHGFNIQGGGVSIHCRIFARGNGGIRVRKVPLEANCKELMEGNFSDVTITAHGNSFQAHKAMLSVRSPVLKAMFLSNLSESKENVLDLSAFSVHVVKGFLEFIYTDRTEILPEYADEWLRISDMYHMNGLKEDVERVIGQTITITNALDIFQIAHTYNTQLLKRTVTKFIKENGKAIAANGVSIVELAKVNPELIAKLFEAIHN